MGISAVSAVSTASSFPLVAIGQRGQSNSCDAAALEDGAKAYLTGMLDLQPGQRVFVVYDAANKKIAKAFQKAAEKIGAEVVLYNIGKNRFNQQGLEAIFTEITDQPQILINDTQFKQFQADASRGAAQGKVAAKYDLFLNFVTLPDADHQGRVKLVDAQIALGQATKTVRTGHGPGVTREMVCARPDFASMSARVSQLEDVLENAQTVRITSALGTDITLQITGRSPANDVTIGPGSAANIPGGELYLAAIEDGANGVMIVDTPVLSAPLSSPIRIELKNGKVVAASWLDADRAGAAKDLDEIIKMITIDSSANVIGEFGIGLAPFPVIDNALQNEKAAGTVHLGLGNNQDAPGGQNTSDGHLDFILPDVTVKITYTPESGQSSQIIMQDGQWRL
ncbi:MAG: aminopeptidase [Candidatus Margulisiibacteriota bacterium]